MESLILPFILAVFSAIGYGFYYAVKAHRKQAAEKRQKIQSLGFEYLENPDSAFIDAIMELHQRYPRQNLKIKEVFRRKESAYSVYILDLQDYSGDSISTLMDSGVAIFSDTLSFPRFSVLFRIPGSGMFANLMNAALDKIAAGRVPKMRFVNHHIFDERYYVLGQNEEAIRALLRDPVLDVLCEKSFRHIEAGHHGFTYYRQHFSPREPGKSVELKDLLQEALELFRVLGEHEESALPEQGDLHYS